MARFACWTTTRPCLRFAISSVWELGDFASDEVGGLAVALVAKAGAVGLGVALVANVVGATGREFAGGAEVVLALFV